jgi:hypothetical protein
VVSAGAATALLLVLSTSELGVRPDFCFEGIATRELASKGAGQTVVRVAERSSQAVGLEGSHDSSEATTPTTTTDALAIPCKAATTARARLAAAPGRTEKPSASNAGDRVHAIGEARAARLAKRVHK